MDKSEVVAIIRSLLTSTPCSSYSVALLNQDFKNETGIDIPLFGYKRIGDFLQSIPDTVKVTGIYPIQKVQLVSNEKSAHIESLVKRQRNNDKEPKSFSYKSRGKKGFIHARIRRPQNFQHQKKIICYFEEGSNDLQSSALIFPEKLSSEKLSPEKLSSEKLSQEKLSSEKLSPEKLSPRPNSALQCTVEADVPLEDCLFTRKSIPFIDLNLYAEVGEYVEVCPCRIVNPHRFYFHLRKLKKKFSNFMRKLQCFYATHENFPRLSYEMMKANFFCVAFYKVSRRPMWHRAEIYNVWETRVTVRLIDQGQTVRVSKTKLKYLHRDFASFPRQALLGYLANIKPSNGDSKWSSEASRRFSDLALGKDLIAGVVCISKKHNCLKMALSCTEGVEIHINDTLVSEGYAEFTENILNSHSAIDLTVPNSSKASQNKIDESEFVIEETCSENLAEILSKSLENYVSTKSKTPIFYTSINNANNTRLKKLFSTS